MSDLVKKADDFAAKAHSGQKDLAGSPYIDHPRTVAACVSGEKAKIVALLHDVVEDAWVSVNDIRVEFGDDIAEAVKVLTRPHGMPYMDYIEIVKSNDLAREVKLADLRHNMDLSRLPNVSDRDIKRVKKYKKAYDILSK